MVECKTFTEVTLNVSRETMPFVAILKLWGICIELMPRICNQRQGMMDVKRQ